MIYIIGFFLLVSIFMNVAFLSRLISVDEDNQDILTNLAIFRDHLTHVNEMPIYTGDDTIQNLLNHSKILCDELNDYIDLYNYESSEEIENKQPKERIIALKDKTVIIREGEQAAIIGEKWRDI